MTLLALPAPSLWTLDTGLAVKGSSITLMPEGVVDNNIDFEDGTLGGFTAYGAGTAVNDATVAHAGTHSLKIPYNVAANLVYKAITGNNSIFVLERWFKFDTVPTGEIELISLCTTTTGQSRRGNAVVLYPSGGSCAIYWTQSTVENTTTALRTLGLDNAPLLLSVDTWYKIRVIYNCMGTDFLNYQVGIELTDSAGTILGGRLGCIVVGNSMPATLYSHLGPYPQGVAGNIWFDDVYLAHGYPTTSPVAVSPWIAIAGNSIGSGSPFVIDENIRIAARRFTSPGTVKYQYATNGGAYNGSWLTKAQLNTALASASITDHTSSLRIKAQFNSDGTQECDISIAGSLTDAALGTNSTPVREQIVDAIETRLATVLTAGGFRTNLGQHVYRWKDRPFLATELPGVDIRDGAEDTGYIAVGEHLHRLSIELRTTATTEAAVRLGIADVVTAVGQDVTWGGLAEDTSIEADGTIDVDGQGADTVYGSKIRLVVEYATAPFTP